MTRTRLAFALAGLTLALGTGVARAETSAGYDKGFFIKSDNWEIHLGTRTQLQLSTTDPDTFMFDSTLGKRTDTDRLNELNIRRFKFFGSGTIFNPAVKFKFQLDVELSRVNPPRSLRMSACGRAPGSGVEVSTDLEIEPVAPNRCRLKWSASSEVRGTVASVGARLLQGTAKKLTESFWEKFAARVGQG